MGWVAIGATLLTLVLVRTLRQAQVPAHHSPFEAAGAPPLAEPMEAPQEPVDEPAGCTAAAAAPPTAAATPPQVED